MRLFKTVLLILVTIFLLQTTGFTQTQKTYKYPDAEASDPNKLGWMQGFPPPPSKLIKESINAHYIFPRTRWSFSHWRELYPTKNVFRGAGPAMPLATDLKDLDGLTFKDMQGNELTWRKSLDLNYTDGILVLHKGKIVYERYFGVLTPERPHMNFSVTKSYVGTLAGIMIAQGKLEPSAPVSRYIPELKNSGYADATVQQLLDMTTGVKFSEDYGSMDSEFSVYRDSASPMTGCPGYKGPKHFYEFLLTVKKERPHGEVHSYKTANTEVLGWILKRISGKSFADLLSELIWSKIGAEQDAYFYLDSVGTEYTGAGFNSTLRDQARFGEMMRQNGYYNGRQIVPASVIEEIMRGGDKDKFAAAKYRTVSGFTTVSGWSYHNQWWISHNEHGAYMARGAQAQNIYIDPKAEMVIVRFASHPLPASSDHDVVTLPAYMAVAKYLMQ